MAEWSYLDDEQSARHIGPTAQDFHAAFGLGDNNGSISTIDPAGVALAAIQALAGQRSEDRGQISEIRNHMAELEEENAMLREELEAIKRKLGM